MKKKNVLLIALLILFLIGLYIFTKSIANKSVVNPTTTEHKLSSLPKQTDVNNAKFLLRDGVPYLDIKDVGVVFHPAWTGIYALQYAGVESYYPINVKEDRDMFFNVVKILEKNLSFNNESAYWTYKFDNTYNNVSIKSPWISSFAQAIGIEVFVTAFRLSNNKHYLELAQKIAKPLFVPISEGGLLYQQGQDIWFEEIPIKDNSTHILNAHLRSLIALDELYKETKKDLYKDYFDKGLATLKKWMPRFDTGTWLKYDLNPNPNLLFRITNPYGFDTQELALDSISLLDENHNVIIHSDLGDEDDFDGAKPIYLSGIDWYSEELNSSQTLRRIKASTPSDFLSEYNSEKLLSPYTYINVRIPYSDSKQFLLKINYKDNVQGNLVLQKRSISPKIKFKNVDNGIFLMKGDGTDKSLFVRIYETDLGYPVGHSYAVNHLLYLEKLSKITKDRSIANWENTARSYVNLEDILTNRVIVRNNPLKLPKQTPVLPILSLNKDKVVATHFAVEGTKFDEGNYDFKSPVSDQLMSPYMISLQALGEFFNIHKHMLKHEEELKSSLGSFYNQFDWISLEDDHKITISNALNWFKNNAHEFKDSLSWSFGFRNAYNDLVQDPGWNSAFGQAYVIKALVHNNLLDMAKKAAYAYKYDITEGGVSSIDKDSNVWFEEVPNKSHILNAHLISLNVLLDNLTKFQDETIDMISSNGLNSLQKYISKFDSGYWSLYDQNPRKEIMLQFDWIKGDKSPLIDEICLNSTFSLKKTCIDVGSVGDEEGVERISGVDWLDKTIVDNKTVRSFRNGSSLRDSPIQGGSIQNSFFWMSIPDREFWEYWDITPYFLSIKYKDISKGQFVIKIQSTREGNYLETLPVYGSNIVTTNSGEWKEHILPIRMNDLGWFIGVDYHKYHVEQLTQIAEKSNDLILKQVSERWKYYLDLYMEKKSPIVEPKHAIYKELKEFKLSSNLKFYKNSEITNAIDGDPNNNYVAAIENIELPHSLEINLNDKHFIEKIILVWESDTNYASEFEISTFVGENLISTKKTQNNKKISEIQIGSTIDKVVVDLKKYNGQQRLLLREIKLYGE